MRNTKINRRKFIGLVGVIAAIALLLGAGIWEWKLSKAQRDALQELMDHKGQYDEQTIVLVGTNYGRANELAQKLDARLRITEDGRFATLTLPEDVTILDVYQNRAYRNLLDDFSPDYMASVHGREEDAQTREKVPMAPAYPVEDDAYGLQTYLQYLNLNTVWSQSRGSGTLIAVIDSGIDTDHPEFAGRISAYSYNATQDRVVMDHGWSIIEDEQGHGTAVAGVISAAMNQSGTVGIAPEAELLIIKAECDDDGVFTRTSDLVFGLYYAIERGADVVNMSFGSTGVTNPFQDAAKLAYDSDILCVAAAGNHATSMLTWPAADPYVVGVGAMEEDGWELADYSNYGENVDLIAPGVTYTTQLGGSYGTMTGTSFASPVVAGALALYLQNNSYQSAQYVTEVLYASCSDLGAMGKDWVHGFGALDISALVQGEKGRITFDMQTNELEDTQQVFVRNNTLQSIPEPERLYAVFDGWYYDPQCTEEYQWYVDVFTSDLTLYAKWSNEDDAIPYTYTTLEDGTIEIRSYTGHRKYITIPEEIDGKVVTSIGMAAFANQERLREVHLPETLRHIKAEAFLGCANLVEIHIPESVETIEESAFRGAVRLAGVEFQGNSDLHSIGRMAFSGCGNLRRFELPEKVEAMDGSVLYGTTALTRIGVEAGNQHFTAKDGVLYNKAGTTLVAYPAGKTDVFQIPDAVTTVGPCAFAYTKLTEIDLNQAQGIGEEAFAFANLKTLEIPDSVTALGKNAFSNNTLLKNITIGSGLDVISASAFSGCFGLESILIPSQITQINESAFEMCLELKNVEFAPGSALAFLGKGCFSMTGLEEITIPQTVVSIDCSAFFCNPSLSRVEFEDGSLLNSIGPSAFSKCAMLKTIVLPDGLWYLGDYAFQFSGLKQVTIPKNVQQIGTGVFASCQSLTAIEVDSGNGFYVDIEGVVYSADQTVLAAYPAGSRNSAYVIPDTVETVAGAAFYGCKYLSSVVIPGSVKTLDEYAFYDCQAVTHYELNEGLQYIASYAFANNRILPGISLPDSVNQIMKYAFMGNTEMGSVSISDQTSLTRLSYGAFAHCGLTDFRVPMKVSTIAQGVFEGCNRLETIVFAENSRIDSIAADSFMGCGQLRQIIFGSGSALTRVGAYGFAGIPNLQRIDFGDAKISEFGNYAFMSCEKLTEITVPDTLVNIGRFAFYGCGSLNRLTLPEGLEHIGSYAFHGAKELDLYFTSDFLPLYVDEHWDDDIRSYHVGVNTVNTQGNWEYAVLNSGNISIISYHGREKSVDLSALKLGGDIVGIGGHAFFQSNVTEVVLPDTLCNIQAYAFAESDIQHIRIPEQVTFIGRNAFQATPIETVAFAGNSQLRVMEQEAFANTEKLSNLTLPASLTQLGSKAFLESGLGSLVFEEGIQLTEIPAMSFAGTNLTQVVIPDSVTRIGDGAFQNCRSLDSVELGSGPDLYISSNAFYHSALSSVHIPETVGYIGEYAFAGLEKLTSFTVSGGNPYYTAVDGLLMNKDQRELLAVPAGRSGTLRIPRSVEVIGVGAFENSALSSVSFASGGNILALGCRAFYGSHIRQIEIPASVVSIDFYAFAECQDLEQVTFERGSKLTGVYEGSFYGCSDLFDIQLPDSVIEISEYAFSGCTALEAVPVSDTSGLQGIFDYAFAGSGITEVIIPDTVTDIGSYAFRDLDAVSIVVPGGNWQKLHLGIGAFAGCEQLEEITLPFVGASYEDQDITWLGYVFGAGNYKANQTYIPQSLKRVVLTEGITCLNAYSFYEICSLEEIVIPHSVVTVDLRAFEGTSSSFELTNAVHFTGPVSTIGPGLTGKLTVAGLPEYAYLFNGCENLTEAELLDTIQSLPDALFQHCSKMRKVTLPDKLTRLGDYAFGGCSGLKEIQIPEGVTEIGVRAFSGCDSLTEVRIPDTVRTIDEYAFSDCTSLMELTLGSGVSSLGPGAFYNNTKLCVIRNHSDLTLTPGSSDYGEVALYARLIEDQAGNRIYREPGSDFTYVDTPDGFRFTLENGVYTLLAYMGEEETVTLPLSVNGSDYVISFFDGIAHLVIPDGMTEIPESAFHNAIDLKSVYIPASVAKIGPWAFARCENLKTVTIEPGLREVGSHSFYCCSSLEGIVLPDTVGDIYDHAFGACGALRNVQLPAGLKSIDSGLFGSCQSLEHMDIPDSVTSVGEGAFEGCAMLHSIRIPENVTSIGSNAFRNCITLDEIAIPAGVSHIGSGAFSGCTSLMDFEIHPQNASFVLQDGVLYNRDRTELLFAMPFASGTVTIADTVTSIPSFAFQECTEIEEVRIPDSVTSVGESAFLGCTGLETVDIPESIQVLSHSVFEGCTSLSQVTLPDTLTEIWFFVFKGCTSLESIDIPYGVTAIGAGAFSECQSLKEIVIPDSVTDLWYDTFSSCSSLERVVLSGGLGTIGSGVFNGCENLEEIVIPEGVTTIEAGAFMDCHMLEHITIPDGMEVIGDDAFRSCWNLRSILIPDSVTQIGNRAFWFCYGLEKVVFGNGVTVIPELAFGDNRVLREVTIGAGVTAIESGAFENCQELRMVHNNSDLLLTIGSGDYGGIARNAWVIVNKDGSRVCAEGYEDYDGPDYMEDAEGFRFVEENGAYYLVGYYGPEDTIVLPVDFGGHPYTIRRLSGVKDVTIPSGVLAIGTRAMSCSCVERVSIGSGVAIEDHAFEYCLKLKDVTIEEGITEIKGGAFCACKALEYIRIPDSVTKLGFGVFQTCTSLKEIDLGSGITTIGGYCFGNTALQDNPDNWENGMLIVGGHLIQVAEDTVFGDWDGKGTIAGNALEGNYHLKQLVIGAHCDDWMSGQPTNLEAILVANTPRHPIIQYIGYSTPMTLKSVVVKSGVDIDDRTFENLTGITIFVEDAWTDSGALWDALYRDWKHGNTVYFGDQWTTVSFFDVDGELYSREFVLNSQVIRKPNYEIAPDDRYEYTVTGWDITGDGQADKIPATFGGDICAYPVVERSDRMFTVTFYDKDGVTPIAQQSLPHGTQITLPEPPEKAGYLFQNWMGYTDGMEATADWNFYSVWSHVGGGHTYDAGNRVAASCTAPGGIRYTCTLCGEWYLEQNGTSSGHSYEKRVVVGCETLGYDLYTCSRCGDSYQDNYTQPAGHAFDKWTVTKNPTCQTVGSRRSTCGHCGMIQTEEMPVLPHDCDSTISKIATCTEEGMVKHQCRDCGTSIQETLPMTDHHYLRQDVPMSILGELIPKLEHMLWGSDGETGYYYICADCGQIQTIEEASSLQSASGAADCGHTHGEWQLVREYDGVNPGIRWRVCTLCGMAIEARTFTTDVCSHDWGEWTIVKEPTETEAGLRERRCRICGEVQREELPAKTPEHLPGDITGDGKVNNRDAARLMQHLAGWDVETVEAALDVNGDGKVNNRDAARLMQYLAGWDVEIH